MVTVSGEVVSNPSRSFAAGVPFLLDACGSGDVDEPDALLDFHWSYREIETEIETEIDTEIENETDIQTETENKTKTGPVAGGGGAALSVRRDATRVIELGSFRGVGFGGAPADGACSYEVSRAAPPSFSSLHAP